MALSPESQAILAWFTYDHLPQGDVRRMAHTFSDFANDLASECTVFSIEDPQMAVGFQRLLDAKDAFVRAAVAEDKKQAPVRHRVGIPERTEQLPPTPIRYEYPVGGGDEDGDNY